MVGGNCFKTLSEAYIGEISGFLTNSSWIAEDVNRICMDDDDHVARGGEIEQHRHRYIHPHSVDRCAKD